MNRGQEILILNVDVSDNKKDKIIVHEYDVPEKLATEFVKKHNLNSNIIDVLAKEIYRNISDLLKPHQNINLQTTYSSTIYPQCKFSNSKATSSTENYGEKLYSKGLKKIEQNTNMKQVLKMQIEQEENQELTFKPKINPISNIIAQRNTNRSQDSIKKKENTIAKYQIEKRVEEQIACSFTPRINSSSNKILQNTKKIISNRFNHLYEEANIRRQKQEKLNRENEFSFKPELCNNYRINSSAERLYVKKSCDDLNNSNKNRELKDPITGQDFFIPIINKGIYYRNREIPIGDHLYSMEKKNIESSYDYSRNPNLQARKKTEELVQKSKVNRYSEIFQQLNPNDEGLISYERINQKYVEPIAYKLLQPLLDELKSGNETLDFEQFYYSMDNLLKILSQDEKKVFTLYKRSKEGLFLSSRLKKSVSVSEIGGVYKRQVEKKLNCQAKLDLEREKRHRSELDGCTFHPQTTPYRIFHPRINASM